MRSTRPAAAMMRTSASADAGWRCRQTGADSMEWAGWGWWQGMTWPHAGTWPVSDGMSAAAAAGPMTDEGAAVEWRGTARRAAAAAAAGAAGSLARAGGSSESSIGWRLTLGKGSTCGRCVPCAAGNTATSGARFLQLTCRVQTTMGSQRLRQSTGRCSCHSATGADRQWAWPCTGVEASKATRPSRRRRSPRHPSEGQPSRKPTGGTRGWWLCWGSKGRIPAWPGMSRSSENPGTCRKAPVRCSCCSCSQGIFLTALTLRSMPSWCPSAGPETPGL